MSRTISFKVNGRTEVFTVGHDESRFTIPDEEKQADTLRVRLGLTGTKRACSQGACGCCTVLKDNVAVPSCQLLTVDCDGSEIVTIEGLADPKTGKLDPLQQLFVDDYAFQCGYCTPGIIMTLKALYIKSPNPTAEEVREALSGNLCRCISQYHVFNAAEHYRQLLNGEAKA